MNIFKIGLILLTGAGFGFGFDKLADSEIIPTNQDRPYGHMYEYEDYSYGGFCHGNEDFLEHMLEDLSETEKVIVQTKIDELLLEYSITLEELNDDYNVRFDFMNDLMDFLEENDIDYHNHGGYHNHDDEDEWHHGMGMH